jgi:hypothetical protein
MLKSIALLSKRLDGSTTNNTCMLKLSQELT